MPNNTGIARLSRRERLNFLLTNRIPRRWATLFFARFSRVRHPLVRDISIAIWRWFSADLHLEESRDAEFLSLHDCFIRRLKEGARPITQDPSIIISPCDAIVGAMGPIRGTELYQVKGFPYTLEELFGDSELVEKYRNGMFITLRLKASMYHRFHAPCDCAVNTVNYISGDTWNVNPVALKCIERLFCKNERAVIELLLNDEGRSITLVPVAAILVASIRLHCLPSALNLKYRGPNAITCHASFEKGQEMGYFEHGSTIIVFSTAGFRICHSVTENGRIRMGEPLMTHALVTNN